MVRRTYYTKSCDEFSNYSCKSMREKVEGDKPCDDCDETEYIAIPESELEKVLNDIAMDYQRNGGVGTNRRFELAGYRLEGNSADSIPASSEYLTQVNTYERVKAFIGE